MKSKVISKVAEALGRLVGLVAECVEQIRAANRKPVPVRVPVERPRR